LHWSGSRITGGRQLHGRSSSGHGGDDVQKFREVLGLVKGEYVDDVKTDVLVEDAIQHLLTKLDPHSTYISAKDREEANEDLREITKASVLNSISFTIPSSW